MKIAQIGYGYWGRNLLRVFSDVERAEVVLCCDSDPKARQALSRAWPGLELGEGLEAALGREDIGAVVLATPAGAHYSQTKAALEAGKHVFVEKPLAMSAREAEELTRLAEERDLRLMVGHTFLYNDAVRWVKDYIDSGELGEVYYAYFQRLNLGRVRQDVNALWNLAPHDISIAHYWLNEEPSRVEANGVAYLQPGIWDVAFLSLYYPSGRFAHVHVSWLDPFKTRRSVIVGSKKMVMYDDTSTDRRIMVFDKGIDRKSLDAEMGSFDSFAQFQLVSRAGDIWIPRIEYREPLRTEAQHFVDCVIEGRRPLSDGESGLRVVKTLEAAQQSCETSP